MCTRISIRQFVNWSHEATRWLVCGTPDMKTKLQCETLPGATTVFPTLCAVNYGSRIDSVATCLHIFVNIIISEHEGQQYFAMSMKDYRILQKHKQTRGILYGNWECYRNNYIKSVRASPCLNQRCSSLILICNLWKAASTKVFLNAGSFKSNMHAGINIVSHSIHANVIIYNAWK